jgi:hypothetical protein
MSDMRKLLESMDKFAGEPKQKPGDQVRGTDNPKKSGKKHGFGDRLVGEDVERFAQELMLEYHQFVVLPEDDIPGNPSSPVANINPAGQGTQANAAANVSTTGSTVQPQTPLNQQPNPAQQAAMKQKEQGDLTKNIAALKTLDPTLNVNKIQQALGKDPKMATAMDNQQLGQLANTLEPVLKNPQAMSSLRGKIQQLTPKV